jgi:hypothetical protein
VSKRRLAGRATLALTLVTLAVGVPASTARAFTVFKVTNTNDSGDGSLRRAINDAKKDPGIDAIFFKIPGPGLHVIQPLTNLPTVEDDIAGDSQPGYAGTPLIQLDGSQDQDALGIGLWVDRGIIAGLDVVNFSDHGIEIVGPATVLANVIGASPDGTVAMGNKGNGIADFGDESAVGDGDGHGNLISGNGRHGIALYGSNVRIEGNRIGTTASGGQALGNGLAGVFLNCDSTGNVIGGPDAAGNVISGNGHFGVIVQDNGFCGTPRGTVVQGNVIGLDAGGTFPVPNAAGGIDVVNATGTHIGTWPSTGNVIAGNQGPGVSIGGVGPGPGTTVDSNLIGVNSSGGESVPNTGPGVFVLDSESTRIGQRVAADHQGDPNVISGNQGGGVVVQNSDSTNVFGNLIGVGANGALPVPNIGHGILIMGGADTHVGGGLVGQGNVISSNTGDGVRIRGDDASGTPAVRVAVQGNWIGTNRASEVSDGNGGNGISVLPQADGTRIGNVVGLEGPNVIAHNSGDGVRVAVSTGVRIRGDSIFENGQLGIELLQGANQFPFPPVLTNVKLANGQLIVKGTLAGAPSQGFAIEVFGSPACDPSGSGEGQSFFIAQKVTTNSSGTATFTIKVPFNQSAAPVVTATATNTKTGDTSQFSQCK